jgi:predicted phosphodiesterase
MGDNCSFQRGPVLRVFAISDIHIDYEENRRWLYKLSQYDYQNDILILAGDVTDTMPLLGEGFDALKSRFREVMYIPGNHDLWVHRNGGYNSLEQFQAVKKLAGDSGIRTEPAHFGPLSIIPLFGWYDYSFGQPSTEIFKVWLDYTACTWPDDFDEPKITQHFIAMNEPYLDIKNQTIISFSHFLPRIDLMPFLIPPGKRTLYPVLGSSLLEQQIRKLRSDIHIYGHSHINMRNFKDNTIYINNAFGYPHETRQTAKNMFCVFEI